MTYWEGAGVFAGIPLLVLFLIAVPIFGPVWLEWLRGRRTGRRPDDPARSDPARSDPARSDPARSDSAP